MMLSRWPSCSRRRATISPPVRSDGKSLPSVRIRPPTSAARSTTYTDNPRSAMASAARSPAGPAPTISTAGTVSTRMFSSGVPNAARATPARTRRVAFSLALGISCRCAHEHCSRMFTCVYICWLMPACCAIARKVSRCSLGEHEATTIPSSFSLRIASIISCCAASEQANMKVFAKAQPGSAAVASRTASTST